MVCSNVILQMKPQSPRQGKGQAHLWVSDKGYPPLPTMHASPRSQAP